MCRTKPGFQNGDCMRPYDVELGNQGNETQIFAFKETIDDLSDCHLTVDMLFVQYVEAWELTSCQNEINWHFYKYLGGNCVGYLQAAGTKTELDQFSSPTETRMCGMADYCKPLWVHVQGYLIRLVDVIAMDHTGCIDSFEIIVIHVFNTCRCNITMAGPWAIIQVCSTHICMVQCTHLLPPVGNPTCMIEGLACWLNLCILEKIIWNFTKSVQISFIQTLKLNVFSWTIWWC